MGKPLENYAPQWEKVRRLRRCVVLLQLSGAAVIVIPFGSIVALDHIMRLPSWIVTTVLLVAFGFGFCLFFAALIVFILYAAWLCPRCGKSFFGLGEFHTVGYWHIERCYHCGLFADAPHADACPDRRKLHLRQ
jgi:hypothetical protein